MTSQRSWRGPSWPSLVEIANWWASWRSGLDNSSSKLRYTPIRALLRLKSTRVCCLQERLTICLHSSRVRRIKTWAKSSLQTLRSQSNKTCRARWCRTCSSVALSRLSRLRSAVLKLIWVLRSSQAPAVPHLATRATERETQHRFSKRRRTSRSWVIRRSRKHLSTLFKIKPSCKRSTRSCSVKKTSETILYHPTEPCRSSMRKTSCCSTNCLSSKRNELQSCPQAKTASLRPTWKVPSLSTLIESNFKMTI